MLENITHREWVDKYEYSHYFSWNDCPGAGFSFDCLEDGAVDLGSYSEGAKENRGDCTYDTDEDAERGYCNGGCVLRPHKFWTDRGPAAVCQRHGCNVAGTGDRCNDGECAGKD